MRTMIGKCPACDRTEFEIKRLSCKHCGTAVDGAFKLSKLGSLASEQQEFVEVFVKHRGNIQEAQRELGLSDIAAQGRLDKAIRGLGYRTENANNRRKEILESLDKQEISSEEAVQALKNISEM